MIARIFRFLEKEDGISKQILIDAIEAYLSGVDEQTIDSIIESAIKRKRELYSGVVSYDLFSKELLEKQRLRFLQIEEEYKEYMKREFGREPEGW